VISAFLPKSLPRRAGAGAAVFAALFVAACTCTTGGGFRITKPTDGAHLPPGDVVVCVTAVPGDFCYFPPKAYEVTLDGGQSRMVAAGDNPLCTTFNGVGAGPHVADAWVFRNGKRAETARAKFVVDAPPPPPTPVPTPVPTPMPAPPPPPPPPPPAAAEEMVTITQKGGYLEDIFFDFNKFVIKPEYHERLRRGAEWIQNHPDTKVTIEGHCDIRGTNKYNLVLGERRSKATFDHMVKLGVDPARMTVTTVGEEQPFDKGENETAYASNRRSHFIITKR
jgi:peptidoglycan-associated lipoprotein